MSADTKPALSIQVGRVYRAKKPSNNGGLFNDRVVLWTNGEFVQYDGPAVGWGRHYPKVSMEKFLAWAGRDVTDEMPPEAWAPYSADTKA